MRLNTRKFVTTVSVALLHSTNIAWRVVVDMLEISSTTTNSVSVSQIPVMPFWHYTRVYVGIGDTYS